MTGALIMLIGFGIDAVLGWPAAVFRRIGHPVTWLGALIHALEGRLNRAHWSDNGRFWGGVATTLCAIFLPVMLAITITWLAPANWLGTLILSLCAWPLIAARSMYSHVAAVARPLSAGDVPQARVAVSMIVGRDPARLDEAGVARAALESLAENSSDGIIAPLFWGALLGLPGIAAYKAINTLDSMIGHRNDRYEWFGKFAARLDDGVNLIPARLTGLIFALVSAPVRALKVMAQDAGKHRSPNAGWPEAALAAGLNVRLSGPRVYGDHVAHEPYVNEGAPDPRPQDLTRGLSLYLRAMGLAALCLALLSCL
ncbi:adenosylcobinamide-phosphate synthase CbiB [Thioclava sp. 'Guangxiensis']|uniref:adenosylcobinamide-phosphate synthase CbiB n=1 Tax=Thioclava sp. 'Guangxiensis' TaxID=3149044 RepID=UPI003877BC9A